MTLSLPDFNPAWGWALAGLALAIAEALIPGLFLVWFGLAALALAAVLAVVSLTWPVQLLAFAVLALAAAGLGRRLTRHDRSALNQRGHDLVGRTFTLDSPITQGTGRLRQGDTSWRITGPDLPAATRVRVVGLDGTTLMVERVDAG